MSEAQRLKMTGGHFIWIWADSSSTAEFFQPTNADDKDQTKANFAQQLGQINFKYSQVDQSQSNQQYFQQPFGANSNKRQNNTRSKTSTNPQLFHHIIGLRQPGDELSGDEGIPALNPDKNFFVPIKEKRNSSGKTRHFDGNDFDPIPRRVDDESWENVSGSHDVDESTNASHDYDKINPYLAKNADGKSLSEKTTDFPSSTRQTSLHDTKTIPKDKSKKIEHRKNSNLSINRNDNNSSSKSNSKSSKQSQPPKASFFDDIDDLDLDEYSDPTDEDPKAKRANSLPSAFNISSHVFFHHYKDFPVGLLALRHIRMNVDRVFVRSAVRLFASTWIRVERDENLRASGKVSAAGRKTNWYDNWHDYDYDDVVDDVSTNVNRQNSNRKNKNKSNVNVNSRHNNARGSKKYRRDISPAFDSETSAASAQQKISSTLVNSSDKLNDNDTKLVNSNFAHQILNVEHLSGLKNELETSETVEIKSNNEYNTTTSEISNSNRINHEIAENLHVDGNIEVVKRQNGFWSSTPNRGKAAVPVQSEKTKLMSRGTPQYRGGCYGVPSRSDIKRSELFAR